jgi:hypothetical protein
MIYELRIYEAIPGKLQALNDRFANFTLGAWQKRGWKVVGFWTETIGTSNQLVYMLGFDNLADREKKFAEFLADPEKKRVFAETEKDGPLVARIRNIILQPTPYSPMQ